MLLLVSFGPWGMFSVSEKSQVNRLQQILADAKILVNNKVENETMWTKDQSTKRYTTHSFNNKGKLTDSLQREVRSILNYLDDHHGFEKINAWYKQDLATIANTLFSSKKDNHTFIEAELYMNAMGLSYDISSFEILANKRVYQAMDNNNVSTVSGYDYLVKFTQYNMNDQDNTLTRFTIQDMEHELIYLNAPVPQLIVKSKTERIELDLSGLINQLHQEQGNHPSAALPIEKMTLRQEGKAFDVKIALQALDLNEENNKPKVQRILGELLLKKKS